MKAKLDIVFPVFGGKVPLDHGYALYGAVSQVVETPSAPWLHEATHVGIHAIRGRYAERGLLDLGAYSQLTIRAPEDWVDRFLPLVGSTLAIDGHNLQIGMATTRGLTPAPTLYAHRVTTRNGQDEVRFDVEIANKLACLGIRGRPVRGKRRMFRIKDRRVVAHSLWITELNAHESMRLMEMGLGGRRKLGCGVFQPWTE